MEITKVSPEFLKAVKSLQENLKKDTEGHGYKYSTLDDLLSEMHEQGLYAVFNGYECHENFNRIHGSVLYNGKVEVSGYADISNATKPKNPQEIMSLLTYIRRYLLYMLLGIQPSNMDDDGAAASNKSKNVKENDKKTTETPKNNNVIKDMYGIEYEVLTNSPLVPLGK